MNFNMDLYKKIIKPQIYNLVRIKNEPNDRFECLRFNKNERLHPFNEILLKDIRRKISSDLISGYFDFKFTYEKLSEFTGFKPSQLLLSFGADMAIKSIYESCIEKKDSIIVPSLSYAMYKVYANMFGAGLKIVKMNKNWNFDIDKMLSCIDFNTKLLVLETPNGSVGTIYKKEEVEKCAKILLKKNIILLIDEVYWGINENYQSVSDIVNKYPNVVIIRSFSKMPGLAGLRIGYLIANEELVEHISKVSPTYESSSFSAMVVETILENFYLITNYKKEFNESKLYLRKELSKLKIKHKDTYANFILIHLPNSGKTKNIINESRKERILLKGPFNEQFLNGWIRLTVGTVFDSMKLIAFFDDFFKGRR